MGKENNMSERLKNLKKIQPDAELTDEKWKGSWIRISLPRSSPIYCRIIEVGKDFVEIESFDMNSNKTIKNIISIKVIE